MADPFIAEIRIFPLDFAPSGWAVCDGQLMPVAQNQVLFSLLGTIYGGNGHSTFALPDMRGRVPIQPGRGPGLSQYELGEAGGSESVKLDEGEIPAHRHRLMASDEPADTSDPDGNTLARPVSINVYQTDSSENLVAMSEASVASTGDGKPHDNMMPFLTMNFCIALDGVYPQRA